jgi:hypothetical protein
MNIHKNARPTPLGRERIVRMMGRADSQNRCQSAGVCLRTVRKWAARYQAEGRKRLWAERYGIEKGQAVFFRPDPSLVQRFQLTVWILAVLVGVAGFEPYPESDCTMSV